MRKPELLQKRAKIAEDARALILAAEKETRSLTSDEQVKYDKMHADIEAINRDIANEERMSAVDADLAKTTPTEQRQVEHATSRMESEEYRTAFDSFLRGRETPEQRQLIQEVRAASPLAVGTAAAGGATVPQGFYNQLQDARKWFGGMFNAGCTVIRTATGNALPVPTANDTGNTGVLLAENAQAAQATTELAFSSVTVNAYKYSSNLLLASIELLQDSAFDIGAYIAKKLGERLGRIQNTHLTVGTGTSQPKGVVTGATLGVTGASGQTTKVIYDDLINLIHKVDPAYRGNGRWMFNDATAAVIELLKDTGGRPLLNSTLQGIDGKVDATRTLLGYPVTVNNDVAVMAANAKSMLFGDFSTYFIRECMDIQLIRFLEKYADYGQVGFLAFMRCDGQPIDAGMHPIQYYANSAT